jgi:hypothetical protein
MLPELFAEANAKDVPAVLETGRTYDVMRTLTVPRRGIMGNGAEVRAAAGFRGAKLLVVLHAAPISGLTLTAVDSRKLDGLVFMHTQGTVEVRDVSTSFPGGDGFRGVRCGVVNLRNCSSTGSGRGFVFTGVLDLRVLDCVAQGNEEHGLVISNCSDAVIAGFAAKGNGFGLKRASSAAGGDGVVILYSQRFSARDVLAEKNARNGFTVGGGDPEQAASADWAIASLVSRSNGGHGLTVDLTVRGREGSNVAARATIANGQFSLNALNGINDTCSSQVIISSNVCDRNAGHGIAIAARQVRLEGNAASSNSGAGMAFFGSMVRNDHGDNVVVGNVISGNLAGPVMVSSDYPERDEMLSSIQSANQLD